MWKRDVELNGRKFGKAAMTIRVEIEVRVDPIRLQDELHRRLDTLPELPRMAVLVKDADGFRPMLGLAIYDITVPWLSPDQLERLLGTIGDLERELVDIRRARRLGAMIEE